MGNQIARGRLLGAFRIVRQLDAGGMGMVYEAVHAELGTHHAIKVFDTAARGRDFLRERFLVEGKLLAKFRHPRIVRVTDLQIDPASGAPYFAMDLVLSPDGQPTTLEAARQRGVDEDLVLGWLRDICDGLAYIHGKGVVHRDISLENVMIGPDGHAVITDFGISRIFDDGLRRSVNLTQLTAVALGSEKLKMGKTNYMAPELLGETPAPATCASDAWALGVLVFRLLTGFWFERDRRKNDMEMLPCLKYDWRPLVETLLNENPVLRLPPAGIASVPGLVHSATQGRWTRKATLCAVSAAVLAALVAGGATWTAFRRNAQPKPDARSDVQTNQTEFTRRSAMLQEIMKSGGLPKRQTPARTGGTDK